MTREKPKIVKSKISKTACTCTCILYNKTTTAQITCILIQKGGKETI